MVTLDGKFGSMKNCLHIFQACYSFVKISRATTIQFSLLKCGASSFDDSLTFFSNMFFSFFILYSKDTFSLCEYRKNPHASEKVKKIFSRLNLFFSRHFPSLWTSSGKMLESLEFFVQNSIGRRHF